MEAKQAIRFGHRHVISRSVFYPAVAVFVVAVSIILGWRQGVFAEGKVTLGNDVSVAVTVADTIKTREKGLSGRKGLGPNEGMLFIFEKPGSYGFWMKDMRFPIDIIWIREGMIVDITENAAVPAPGARLPLYYPKLPADKVLEVRSGFAKANGVAVGEAADVHVDKR